MRMISARRAHLLDPAEMRLPLIALIDVILFLLMYFLFAGNLESEERELAAALAAERATASTSALAPQVVEVVLLGGGEVYRLGSRVIDTKAALAELISGLPKEPGLVVRADDGVSIGAVAAATQAARDAGFDRITYQPRPRGR
jgi:biopolymer transport protein ExbD